MLLRPVLSSSFLLFSLVAPSIQSLNPFNPYLYPKSHANCPAVDHRNTPNEIPISLNLSYLDINPLAEKTLILVHGWPSLWTTYRHQIERFGDEYRLLIPEHRGYGDSEHPEDLGASNAMFDFVNDIQCIMDHAGVDSGVCIGNDFGAQVCWEAGRSRPDRFIGVFKVGIPPETAAKELDADPRSAIRSCAQVSGSEVPEELLLRNDSFLAPWEEFQDENDLTEIPFSGIMPRLVEARPFNGYQHENRRLNYEFEMSQGNFTLLQPTFIIFPTSDPVADWVELAHEAKAASFLTDHYNATIPTAHWPHEELPDQFNDILADWLGNVTFPAVGL